MFFIDWYEAPINFNSGKEESLPNQGLLKVKLWVSNWQPEGYPKPSVTNLLPTWLHMRFRT